MGIAAKHLGQAELQGVAVRILTEARPEGEHVWAYCPWHTESTPGNAFRYTPRKDWGFCHGCGNSGDIVDIFAAVHGLENKEAVKQFMRDFCPQGMSSKRARDGRLGTPDMPKGSAGAWRPKEARDPDQLWLDHAVKMVTWGQEQLGKSQQVLDYLAGRGIPAQAARDYGLGLIPQDMWRERRSWGLDPKYRDDGKEKKLWIPGGIVVPYYLDGALHRVRIRRWEGDPKYYWLPGSATLSPWDRARPNPGPRWPIC